MGVRAHATQCCALDGEAAPRAVGGIDAAEVNVTRHTSQVTRHASPVTRHTSPAVNRPVVAKETVARLQLHINHLPPPHNSLYVLRAQRVSPARQQAELVRPFDYLNEE